MQIVIILLLAAAVMLILATVMSFVLGWANRAFHVPVDARQRDIEDALPGANCGACGYAGCREYAEAVVDGEAPCNLCTVGGAPVAERLAEIMGVDAGENLPKRAVVHCAARHGDRLGERPYTGEPTCVAANQLGGIQGCLHGCLGFGDCVAACAFDAIHVKDGLATVDYAKCVGCGACVKVCPRDIIDMIPMKNQHMLVVACSNPGFGKEIKAVCTTGCIGCKACTKQSELFTMDGNLAVVDYGAYAADSDPTAAAEKCPTKVIRAVGTDAP